MRNLLKPTLAACALVAVFMAAGGKVNADPLVLTVTNPIQSVAPGGSVILAGFVVNPNAQSFTISTLNLFGTQGFFPIQSITVPAGFVTNPVAALGTASGNLVSINFLTTAAPGVYNFTFAVNGSIPGGPGEASNRFPVTITVVQPVPEPTTMILLGTGLVGIAIKVRKRRKAV